MTIFAIELSSPRASVAIVRDGDVLAGAEWEQQRRGNPLLDHATRVLEESGLDWEGIDLYAVGRGPGNYTGMRLAVTTAQALALPDGKPVRAISSGQALAMQVLEETGSASVAIVGDARRDRLWLCCFDAVDGGATPRTEWRLCTVEEAREELGASMPVASSEYTRLQPLLPGVAWLEGDRFPQARWVAAGVLRQQERDEPSEPLTPLYLHPAVAPKPQR